MKKIVASVGLVALGASSIQTASAQELGLPDNSKPWSVSATLRGFYDDNTSTLGDAYNVAQRDSWGFELSPSAKLDLNLDPTTSVSVGYLYSLKYYEDKPPTSGTHDDQTHTFNVTAGHRFSSQVQAKVSDSFVIGQEADMLRAGNTFSTYQRISGNNVRNYGTISLDAQITRQFGVSVGYDNSYYNYDADGAYKSGSSVMGSVAGLLNRMENGAHIEGLWQIQPDTKGLLGYKFRDVGYNGDEFIGGTLKNANGSITSANLTGAVQSDNRNSREHAVYIGGEQLFTPELSGGLRVGASYTEYYNAPQDGSFTPYVNLSARYAYAPESYVEGGFTYDRNATDQIDYMSSADYTLDAESAVVYLSINHRITPKLFGSLVGQYQNSKFNGGSVNNMTEDYYLVGLNLEYRFTSNVAFDIGYNYDLLHSQLGDTRSFDRNRVYFGITATY